MFSVFQETVTVVFLLVLVHNSVATVSGTVNVAIRNYADNQWTCIGGEEVGLTNTSVQFQYRTISTTSAIGNWITLAALPVDATSSTTLILDFNDSVKGVQFRLLQLEHGGRGCNCWRMEAFNFMTISGDACYIKGSQSQSRSIGNRRFCGGIASDARGLISRVLYFNGTNGEDCPGDSSLTLISNKGPSLPIDCSTAIPRIVVTYGLLLYVCCVTWPRSSCNGIDTDSNEYIEFAMRNNTNSGPWIPLQISYHNTSIPSTRVVRGYNVSASTTSSTNVVQHTVHICGDILHTSQVQFRWMGTAILLKDDGRSRSRSDIWALANVNVILIDDNNETTTLFSDGFGCDSQNSPSCVVNSSLWREPRRGNLNCTACSDTLPCRNHYLTFGANNAEYRRREIVSRVALTQNFSVEPFVMTANPSTEFESASTTTDTPTTEAPTTTEASTTMSTTITMSTTTETPTTMSTTTEAITTMLTTTEASTTMSTTTEATTTMSTTTEASTTMSTTTEASTTMSTTTEASTTMSTTETPTIISTTEASTTMSTTTEGLTMSTTEALTTMSTTTETPTTMSTTTEIATITASTSMVSPLVLRLSKSIQDMIKMNQTLKRVTSTTDPLKAVDLVQNLTTNGVQPNTAIYLLGNILNRLNSTDANTRNQLSRTFLTVGNTLTKRNEEIDAAVTGSSLLSVYDRLALEVFQEDGNISAGNIVLNTRDLSFESKTLTTTTINSADFNDTLPEMSLQIPRELVQRVNRSGNGSERVRAVAFLYYNVEGLFPSGLQMEENNTELASGIISTALQVGESRYPTENLNLSAPIRIQMKHSDKIKDQMLNDSNLEITCVFWKFAAGRSAQDNSILSVGQWSDRGCNRSDTLSNSSVTVCECNHLTHFAILLSPRPLNLTQPVTLSLQIIGYVGVTISLVAMALTVIIILIQKPLRNMRNIIHINLCISLGIAQLIFVIGVTRSDPTSDRVPVYCQVIAVLLHYFFLVSFMWMLMEGVVLYVVLVRVFVKYGKRYLMAFTIISYTVPLLYMGLLTLPLGFALPTQPNYGYLTACFLNPGTNFIWAFIVPVVVIIFINCGFFVMALTIMCRHQKKQTENTRVQNVKTWLKGAVSLVVIMGLTWILGVLIVEVKALLPLAYIYTIMVAFQGLSIFIIFIVFSKQVREAYTKWWRIKVNESDILSKYFGEKLTRTTAVQNKSKLDISTSNTSKDKEKFDMDSSTAFGDISQFSSSVQSSNGGLIFTNTHIETPSI